MRLLNNPKFAEVVSHFEKCCQASRQHSQLASESLNKFGDQGSQISGYDWLVEHEGETVELSE